MVTLLIDFQEGFTDDTIEVKINDKASLYKEHVTTNLLIGLAESFKSEVDLGQITVEINITTKHIAKILRLQVIANVFVGISIQNSTIDHIVSDKPFSYG